MYIKGIENYWHGVVNIQGQTKDDLQLPKWFSLTIRCHLKCICTLRKRLHHHFTLTSLPHLIQLEDFTLQEVNNAKERK